MSSSMIISTSELYTNKAEANSSVFIHLYEYHLLFACFFRLLIKNGNHIDSPPLYDSYEVEYLPNEGIVSTSRYLFVELTTDGSGTSTGMAVRYEGRPPSALLQSIIYSSLVMLSYKKNAAVNVFTMNFYLN